MKTMQSYNKKIKAYVKYEIMKSGKARIMNVKQSNKDTPFKRVPIKKKK
jgi:hypothetical protein